MGEVYARTTRSYGVRFHQSPPRLPRQRPRPTLRFEEEARSLAALNHPNIGAIYGVEESGDVAALVLELVDGPTLSDASPPVRVPFDEIVWIARQLADGLEAAHDRGIVHRDLKPPTSRLLPRETSSILDFGWRKQPVCRLASRHRTCRFPRMRRGSESSSEPSAIRAGASARTSGRQACRHLAFAACS